MLLCNSVTDTIIPISLIVVVIFCCRCGSLVAVFIFFLVLLKLLSSNWPDRPVQYTDRNDRSIYWLVNQLRSVDRLINQKVN